MKTFYVVRSSYDDRGHIVTHYDGTIEAEKMPEMGFVNGRDRDIYTDYFNTRQEAMDFVRESKYA